MISFIVNLIGSTRAPWLLVTLWVLAPLVARAEGEGASAATSEAAPPATAAYERGVAHFKAGRYLEAIQEFNKAYRVDQNPVLIYNMARAFEELGEFDNAVSYYKRYLAKAPADAPDRDAVGASLKTLQDLQARKEATALHEVAVTSSPDGASISIDGEPVGQAPLKYELSKGRHFVVAEYDGFSRTSRELLVEGDSSEPILLELVPVTVAPASKESRVIPWTLVGVGGAFVAGAAVAGVMALDKSNELDDIDAGDKHVSPAEYNDLQDEGSRFALAADGLLIAGAVSIATGVTLLLWGDDAPTQTPEGQGDEIHPVGFTF